MNKASPKAQSGKKSALSSHVWERIKEETAFRVFQTAAMNVPAYKRHLAANKFSRKSIHSWQDFLTVPTINKKEYLRPNALQDLVERGALDGSLLVYSTSSGSTGTPFYYPRKIELAEAYARLLDGFLGLRPSRSVLAIVCFGMGVWVGGTHTYEALLSLGKKRPLSVIAPGVNKVEILRAVRELSPKYEQVVIAGYPPFIKDIVEEIARGHAEIDEGKFRFIFAAEVFSEDFRDYVGTMMKCKSVYQDTMNIYGTADLGAMARETPLSILIKRLALQNVALSQQLFAGDKVPTLAQYDPSQYVFESVGGIVHVTADNAIPLVRYSLGDRGGAWSYAEVEKMLRESGVDIQTEAKKEDIATVRQPFVFVAERDDFSVSLYGLQIYPEYFRAIFLDGLAKKVTTGKFCLEIKHKVNHDQFLEIHVEMRDGVPALEDDDRGALFGEIYEGLRHHSSEFRELTNHIRDRELLVMQTHPLGSPPYFSGAVKQRWVI